MSYHCLVVKMVKRIVKEQATDIITFLMHDLATTGMSPQTCKTHIKVSVL